MTIRIGLFGGSFNPVHNGHLAAARAMKDQIGLDRVVLIPSGQPPLKGASGLLDGNERLAMIRLALEGNSAMQASAIELQRPGPSYTVDTVRSLRERFPVGSELFFLLGSDCLERLPMWKGIDELHAMLRFAIVQRAGSEAVLSDLRLLSVAMAALPISSTEIRSRIALGYDLAGLVPPAVATFIQQHGLYRLEEAAVS